MNMRSTSDEKLSSRAPSLPMAMAQKPAPGSRSARPAGAPWRARSRRAGDRVAGWGGGRGGSWNRMAASMQAAARAESSSVTSLIRARRRSRSAIRITSRARRRRSRRWNPSTSSGPMRSPARARRRRSSGSVRGCARRGERAARRRRRGSRARSPATSRDAPQSKARACMRSRSRGSAPAASAKRSAPRRARAGAGGGGQGGGGGWESALAARVHLPSPIRKEAPMPAPEELRQLVARYSSRRDAHGSAAYDETRLERELLAPFLGLLGWEMGSGQGHAEVVHEEQLRVDYTFRIGGARKLFLQIERPSVDIVTDGVPAYQLRRFAWSAGLPLSILTNFEHLAVYDARIRPHKDDRASVARVLLLADGGDAGRGGGRAGLLSRRG